MIQLAIYGVPGDPAYQKAVYLDLADKWITSDPDTKWLLGEFTSQFTGKTTFQFLSSNWTNQERYVQVTLKNGLGLVESKTYMNLGTTDNPLGLYDVTIYQNSSGDNLNTSGLNVLYNGIMNVTLSPTDFFGNPTTMPVKYTEYTTNDSDTESIYLTNTAV
tara:strand:- start:68 stop:550 length:483 start_codon:yes stop_codon:yes gene_type:complete